MNKHEQIVNSLRTYGGSHVELTRAFADSLGLHSTDAAALSEIIYAEDRGDPISPMILAKKLGLSKSALSACINRLETAEHVKRMRESSDRRVITLHCSPDIYKHAGLFFMPLSAKMEIILNKLSQSDAEIIDNFLRDSSKAISDIVP